MLEQYSTAQVAEFLGWPQSRVYRYVKDGLVNPDRAGRGYAFAFRDLVVLRAADQLIRLAVSPRRVRQTLNRLAANLDAARPLSTVNVGLAGNRIVSREGAMAWEVDSGQAVLDLGDPPPATASQITPRLPDSDDLYHAALEVEEKDAARAIALYQQAIEADESHPDAYINLGRLKQRSGDLAAARAQYAKALRRDPDSPLARFNLATALEEGGDLDAAEKAYLAALEVPHPVPETHLNLARIYSTRGDLQRVIRHLRVIKFWQN